MHPRSWTARPWKPWWERKTSLSYWVSVTFQGRLLLNFGRVVVSIVSQMRRMYGLFTYMKGETWQNNQASHLVNIPIPWSIWVLNCNPYFGKWSNLTNIFVNSFIETRVYSLCHTLWCCWWWNSGMTVNNWWLTLSSHLKIDALKTIFPLWGSSYFWGANCWFQRVYYTWDNF